MEDTTPGNAFQIGNAWHCPRFSDKRILRQKIFHSLTNVKGLRASEYYDIVRKPMDLGTIKCRLEKGRYFSRIEFAQDVQLTFGNATHYNNPTDVAYKMAQELLELFTLEW